MRLFFFIFLILALVLNTVSLFIGGHPGLDADEIAILIASGAILIAVAIMAWRGKVFKRKGKWVYNEKVP
jgi:hypothetical protein